MIDTSRFLVVNDNREFAQDLCELMTACPDEALVTRARLAGAIEVLSKPLVMERWLELAAELKTRSRAGSTVSETVSSVTYSQRPL